MFIKSNWIPSTLGYGINYNVKGSPKDKTNASDTAVVTKNEATDGLVPFQGQLELVAQNFGGKKRGSKFNFTVSWGSAC